MTMQTAAPTSPRAARVSFAKCRSGVAALEFALIFPVLVLLFFGVVEGSDALSATRRAALASNTLADLVAQETSILKSDVDKLYLGVGAITGVDESALTIRLVSVIANPADEDGDGVPDGDPIVHWSYDNAGGEPYPVGASYTGLASEALLDPTSSIVVSEIVYPYTSSFSSKKFISSITFEKSATRWPRRSARVQLCNTDTDCTS